MLADSAIPAPAKNARLIPAAQKNTARAEKERVPHQATFARLTIRRRRGSLVWRFRQAM